MNSTARFSIVAALLVLLAGCPRTGGNVGSQVIGEGDNNHLQDAVSRLPILGEIHPERGISQMQFSLDRWLETQTPDPDWQPDPMFERLPPQYGIVNERMPLNSTLFSNNDIMYLRQCYWSRTTGEWVLSSKSDPSLDRWTASDKPSSGDDAFLSDISSTPLEEAVKLFDWTVCNVRLEQLRELKDIDVGPQASGDRNSMLPAAYGAPGPGYTMLPWETMLYAHGDFWQRSRVFIQLARQRGIEAFVLGIDEGSATGRATPWAVGVLIDDDIFMFDARIGLPIPGPGGKGVATLQQAQSDPSILQQCDVTSGGEKIPYAVTEKELRRIVALVDASPEAISLRMAMLESALTGADRLVLSVSPTDLAERLNDLNIPRVRLWRTPIEASIYRDWFMSSVTAVAYAENKASLPPIAIRNYNLYLQNEMTYRGPGPFSKARDLHLRGIIENTPDRDGAKAFYMLARIPDAVLNEVPNSVKLQQQMGIYDYAQSEKDPEARKALIKNQVMGFRQSKEQCNQFLALVQFAQGNFSPAKNWAERAEASSNDMQSELEKIVAEEGGFNEQQKALLLDGLARRREILAWSQYLHARSHEALEEIVDAKVLLREIESPQRQGNFIRAQWAGREPGQPLSQSVVANNAATSPPDEEPPAP